MKGKNLLHQLGYSNAQPSIIQIDSDAFEKLLDAVIDYVVTKCEPEKDVWISEKQVLELIGITSKTTLLKLRQQGRIKYTQPYKRVLMYSKKSVLDFLNEHVRDVF